MSSSDNLPLRLHPEEFCASRRIGGDALRRSLSLVTLSWVFGSVWASATSGAPITLFAQHLKASKFEFGLLGALPFIASLISMPACALTERTGARKRIFLFSLYAQRLMWFPLAIVPVWIMLRCGAAGCRTAMLVFLMLTFIMHATGAIGGPGWLSWMADVVPDRVRGKYFSRRRQWGIMSAVPAALFAGWMLDRVTLGHAGNSLQVLGWCAVLFMCSAMFGLIDIHLFQYVPEVRMKPQTRTPLLHIFSKPLRDPQFLWIGSFIATLVFAVTFMGQFVTLYLIERVGVTNTGTQLMLLVAPMLAQLIVLPVWGRAADRYGKKPVLALASLGLVPVGFGWCLMSSGSPWLGYFLSASGAALWTGVEVANLNLVLEFSGSKGEAGGGSSYVAVNSVIINVAGCLGGLSAGVIAQWLRDWKYEIGLPFLSTVTFYEVLFALSAVLRLAAVAIFLPHIHEPRAGTAKQTLQFITANIYNNLFNAILIPLRLARGLPLQPAPRIRPRQPEPVLRKSAA